MVQLANLFISGNWDLLPVFKAIFKSEHFYDENIIGAQIKSPMECFVDLMRSSGIPAANLGDRYGTVLDGSDNLGMDLLIRSMWLAGRGITSGSMKTHLRCGGTIAETS